MIAREVGGGARAQLLAAACTAVSGFALAVGHFVTTTTFDLLSTTAFGWLLIRAVARGSGAPLLAAGVVAGSGSRPSRRSGWSARSWLLTLAASVRGGRCASWWTAGGVVAAVAIAAPVRVWQQQHGWPQITVATTSPGAPRAAGSASSRSSW